MLNSIRPIIRRMLLQTPPEPWRKGTRTRGQVLSAVGSSALLPWSSVLVTVLQAWLKADKPSPSLPVWPKHTAPSMSPLISYHASLMKASKVKCLSGTLYILIGGQGDMTACDIISSQTIYTPELEKVFRLCLGFAYLH